VARDLLGRLLVRRLSGIVLIARIVEAEAYQEDDPASHSYRGHTTRTEVMFGPPGHLYVYFSYGTHWCMNVVTGKAGEGSAVLLRAAEPLEGLELMRQARGVDAVRSLCSGPGKLTQAFGVTKSQNGLDLVSGQDLYLVAGGRLPEDRLGIGPRVGISVAADVPWRFFEKGSPFVSRGAFTLGDARPTARRRARRRATGSGRGSASDLEMGTARGKGSGSAKGRGRGSASGAAGRLRASPRS
jgi:DNA-3-methyladenine glycosylase